MGRPCSACRHAKRTEIDAGLVAGDSYRDVARRHGLTSAAVHRHRQHVPAQLAEAHDAATAADAGTLLGKVASLEADARRIAATAEAGGDLRTAIAGIRELTRIVQLLAELRGELQTAPTVNVLVMPEWLATRATILRALAPYPDARLAVASALATGS